jgi:hypothetical protein
LTLHLADSPAAGCFELSRRVYPGADESSARFVLLNARRRVYNIRLPFNPFEAAAAHLNWLQREWSSLTS